MQLTLREHVPELPEAFLGKAELMFTGLRFTDALARAVDDGTAPSFYPYRRVVEKHMLDAFGAGAEQLEVALNELIPKRIEAVMRAAAAVLRPRRLVVVGHRAAGDVDPTSGVGEPIS